MNRSSLRLCVAIALAGSALMACVTAADSSSDQATTGVTKQALRNCPDGPCEPVEPPPKHNPPPPPAPTTTPPPLPLPTGVWNVGNPPVVKGDETFTFQCKGSGLGVIPVSPPECWNITPCAALERVVDGGDGGHCGGYTYASRYLCPRLGTYPMCDAYGTCTCVY